MSEQIGWRSVVKTLKKELPFILKNTPQIPRLINQFLLLQTQTDHKTPHQLDINSLIKPQTKQANTQKWMTVAIVILVILQIASLVLIVIDWS